MWQGSLTKLEAYINRLPSSTSEQDQNKVSDRSAINEIILSIFLKTNIEGELIREIGNEFQSLGPP